MTTYTIYNLSTSVEFGSWREGITVQTGDMSVSEVCREAAEKLGLSGGEYKFAIVHPEVGIQFRTVTVRAARLEIETYVIRRPAERL